MNRTPNTVQLSIRPRVTCPHCWETYPSEDSLWIAQHEDLRDDPLLGHDAQQRFLPTRFDIDGNAIDILGMKCQALACPKCHLPVPRALYEMACQFYSIMGTPSCGKSYFLASMTWQLRQTLPKIFQLSWTDADPISNAILNSYEQLQFFNSDQEAVVKLEKTQEQGDLYDAVRYGDQVVSYPRPFMFSVQPLPSHPSFTTSDKCSRVICMYDNAGESFQPGRDTTASPVTRHLARSQVLFFLFDPTQDPRFREACQECRSQQDPQMVGQSPVHRQDIVLNEAASRIRKYSGLKTNEQHQRPLIVVVTKYDAWSELLNADLEAPPWRSGRKSSMYALDLDHIATVSQSLRELLWKYSPEIVSAAEGFARQVVFVPVSATGTAPIVDPKTGLIRGIRIRNIRPRWVEVPLLLAFARWSGGLVPYWTARTAT